tara:strand:+ start:314 stop:1270 length:957 start_codon:yes stop_codon:yes gene_type:complete
MAEKFAKPVLSFSEHIELLKARGLKFEDETRAKLALRQHGYFRLSGYWLVMLEKDPELRRQHRFKQGSSFGRAFRLYEFDRRLRILSFEALEKIEIGVRTCISNTLAISTRNPHWFLDSSNFNPRFDHTGFLKELEAEAGNTAAYCGKKGRLIRHGARKRAIFIDSYHQNYNEPSLPPTWMLSEVLTLGRWSKIYQGLVTANQKLISTHMGPKWDVLSNWLEAVTILRNACAHHSRIWNRPFSPVSLQATVGEGVVDPSRFGGQATVVLALLRRFTERSHWIHRVRKLMESYPEADPQAMGFMPGWQNHEFWKFESEE